MKCFEIGEEGVEEGILVTFSPNGPCVVLGSGSREEAVPLGLGLARLFTEEDAAEDREVRLKWADLVHQKTKEGALPQNEEPSVDGTFLLTQERNPRDRRALVKVDFTRQPGVFDQTTLTANSYSEVFNETKDAVIRKFHEWPPIGINAKVGGYHEKKSKQGNEDVIEEVLVLLLEMLPGSSFRIMRGHAVAIPEVLIVWNGKTLRQIVPGKYQDRKNQV